MQRTCPHLAPILPRCGADLAHCIRLHIFVARGRGREGYCDWEDTPELPTLTICAEMNLGQQQQPQQRQRRQHAVRGKVAETFQENHDFLLKIFLGLPNGNASKQQGRALEARGGGSCCCKLCGRFRFGFGIDFALSQISNRSFIWQLCPILDRERRICMERFARDLSMIWKTKNTTNLFAFKCNDKSICGPGGRHKLFQQLI